MISISAQIEGMTSRADKSWKIILGTQELSPEMIGQVGMLQNQVCYVAINPNPFTSEEREAIENTKAEMADNSKSPSQRLRGVFYIKWKAEPEGYENFHDYYIVKMDKIINHYKSLLPS